MRKKTTCTLVLAVILMISVSSCNKDLDIITSSTSTSETNELNEATSWSSSNTDIYLLANGTRLDKFNSGNMRNNSPKSSGSAPFTGLQPGETILGIDFRPATGQLYGLGSTSRLYVINPTTGAARMIGTGPFTPALTGTLAGFDFNPTVDRIRVVTNSGQNLRLNPETGANAAIDGSISPTASISAVAYTNNFAGATTTTLYDIDANSNTLFKQDPPNNGTLVNIGPLNLDVDGEGSFDISPDGTPLALFKVNNVTTFFQVNLNSGAANVLATFPGIDYIAIAIYTRSVGYATTSANNLLIFDLQFKSIITKTITGLSTGETILGLDMRPLNGQLYALGSNSNIYTINSASGAATLAYNINPAIPGTSFGFDFNPVVDRIRIVSNTGENRRFNPNDGSIAVDGNLNPGSPAVSSVAYNNNFAGTTTTTLFAIDHNSDQLFNINPPNNGTLVFVENLNFNTPAINGFDIGGTSNNAYLLFDSGSGSNVYGINLITDKTTLMGSLGNVDINGLAIGLGF
jgi:hypothetical protein